METKQDKYDVGVIIGRFQVDSLHQGHIELIEHVQSKVERVIIFLGLSALKTTRTNPLDFHARRMMIQEQFPDVDVLYVDDLKSDANWSKKVDYNISKNVGPDATVGLFGSRDAFINHYSGRYPTIELSQDVFVSGTSIRRSIGLKIQPTKEFRAGVIWATCNQYKNPKCTVDIAIFNSERSKILLGKKPTEEIFRFIGGFIDVNESAEQAASREVHEEAGVEVGGAAELSYVGSYVIDDWRYRSESENILTMFFEASMKFGRPEPGDDISELAWLDLTKLPYENEGSWKRRLRNLVVEEHQVLMDALFEKSIKTNQALIVEISDVEED